MITDTVFIENCMYVLRAKNIIAKVVPQEQTFMGDDYTGKFETKQFSSC